MTPSCQRNARKPPVAGSFDTPTTSPLSLIDRAPLLESPGSTPRSRMLVLLGHSTACAVRLPVRVEPPTICPRLLIDIALFPTANKAVLTVPPRLGSG